MNEQDAPRIHDTNPHLISAAENVSTAASSAAALASSSTLLAPWSSAPSAPGFVSTYSEAAMSRTLVLVRECFRLRCCDLRRLIDTTFPVIVAGGAESADEWPEARPRSARRCTTEPRRPRNPRAVA